MNTDNHLVLWDLKPQNLTGSKMQTVCDHCSITLNKNAVLGDKSALTPGGVRVGTPALTTRGDNPLSQQTLSHSIPSLTAYPLSQHTRSLSKSGRHS